MTAAEVVGTDLCFGLAVSAVGSIIQIGAGKYNGHLLMRLVAGGLFGALMGSLLAGKIAQRPPRVVLLVMLAVLGCQLALHGGGSPAGHTTLRAAVPAGKLLPGER